MQLNSPESEKILLAICLTEDRKNLQHGLLNTVSSDDFFSREHQDLWTCIKSLHDANAPADIAAVLDFSRAKNIFVGGAEYLVNLTNDPLTLAASDESVLGCSKRIKDLSTLRRLNALMLRGAELAMQGPTDVNLLITQIEDDLHNLRKISNTEGTGPKHISESLATVLAKLEDQMDGKVEIASQTGYADLDAMIYGLSDEDFVVVGARPSMGKTAFITNIARNGAMNEKRQNQLIFSLEMKQEALARRLLAREAQVGLGNIRTATLTDHDFSRISEGLHQLGDAPIFIDDTPGLTIHDIRSRARAFVQKHGKTTIYLDYIQFVSQKAGSNRSEREHVSETSRGLKNLARELKCPVVALSQLSRTLEARTNKRPMMSDLRESGAIEQDADIILFLYRDEYYNPDTQKPGTAEVIIAKQRDGAVGFIDLGFNGTTSHFYDISH